MPVLGYGTGTAFFQGRRGADSLIASVTMALDAGILHVDEAEMYKNQDVTGQALQEWFRKTGTPRSSLFVTGKVLSSVDGHDGWSASMEASCRSSIEKLGIEYFDLYLLHAPYNKDGTPFQKPLPEVWKEMEALIAKGLTKAIGVSNWRIKDIAEIYDGAVVKPSINQVENHPHLRQPKLMQYCAEKGIAVASYAGLKPVTTGDLHNKRLMTEVVPRIATAHGKTHAQILQRWNYQSPPLGRKVVITTTQNAERVAEYLNVFDGSWALTDAEMADINAAGNEHVQRFYWDSKLDEE